MPNVPRMVSGTGPGGGGVECCPLVWWDGGKRRTGTMLYLAGETRRGAQGRFYLHHENCGRRGM